MRKKIVEIFAAALGLDGYWTTKTLFTVDEKKLRRKVAAKKFEKSEKGQNHKLKYRTSERCKRLRRENYTKNKKSMSCRAAGGKE